MTKTCQLEHQYINNLFLHLTKEDSSAEDLQKVSRCRVETADMLINPDVRLTIGVFDLLVDQKRLHYYEIVQISELVIAGRNNSKCLYLLSLHIDYKLKSKSDITQS